MCVVVRETLEWVDTVSIHFASSDTQLPSGRSGALVDLRCKCPGHGRPPRREGLKLERPDRVQRLLNAEPSNRLYSHAICIGVDFFSTNRHLGI